MPETNQHAYFEGLLLRGDFFKAHSLRPIVGMTNQGVVADGTAGPYYESQLTYKNAGGYQEVNSGGDPNTRWVTYDYADDTNPQKQDAAKVTMPQFVRRNAGATLSAGIDDTTQTIPLTDVANAGHYIQDANSNKIKIDDEIMLVTAADATANTVTVTRHANSTAAASHSSGAIVYANSNLLETYIMLPVKMTAGFSYLVTWDGYWTDTFSGMENHKAFQFVAGGNAPSFDTWMEQQIGYDGAGKPGYSQGGSPSAVAVPTVRNYQVINAPGSAIWSSSEQTGDGRYGPNYVGGNPPTQLNYILPREATPTLYANRWCRFWWVFELVSNDYTYISVYFGDSQTDAIEIIHRFPASLITDGGEPNTVSQFCIELNTSTSPLVGTAPYPDRVIYLRNVAILRDANLATDWTSLMTKPV